MSDWQIAGVVAVIVWLSILTMAVFRLADVTMRLDKVLSDALTALGFPKKDAP